MILLPEALHPAWAAGGLAGAGAVALLGVRLGWLTRDGGWAAVLVGTAVVAGAGLYGGMLLLAFFVSSSALGRFNPRREGPRRAGQVLANGGVAALAALARGAAGWSGWEPETRAVLLAAIAGSLAAMAADTWASEAGQAWGGTPAIPFTGERVPPGTPGGVTRVGSAASLAGAAWVAGLAAWPGVLEPVRAFAAVWSAGLAGAWMDTLLGATLERRGRLDNQAVNAAASLTGAVAAAVLYWIWAGA